MIKIRESNFELLRLVCMFYIVLHHFIIHGLNNADYFGGDLNVVSVIFNSFFVIGVNCFVLISGYFGIKPSWKGFVHLYIMCVSYILCFSIIYFINNSTFNLERFIYSFLPISHSGNYWFIKCYFYLYFVSFILNKAVSSATERDLMIIIIILSMFTFYFGFYWRDAINSDGYKLMNFILLYFIGRYIKQHTKVVNPQKQKYKYLIVYVLSSFIIAGGVLMIYCSSIDNKWIFERGFAYNNPFVIISAISFLLLFRCFQVKSLFINKMASSTLAIYLIHESSKLRIRLYDFIGKIAEEVPSEWLLIIILPLVAILLMVVCIGIDKIRILITNPIERMLVKMDFNKYLNKVVVYVKSLQDK